MKRTKWKLIPLAILLTGSVGILNAQSSGKSLRTEKTAIRHDISKVERSQQEVKALKVALREDQPGISKGDFCKAKADLKRDKAYLKADKMALMARHNEIIHDRQTAYKEYKTDIRAERRQLNMALAKGDNSAINHTENILEAKLERNEDLVAINKQISDVEGQNALVLNWETYAAKAQNLALK